LSASLHEFELVVWLDEVDVVEDEDEDEDEDVLDEVEVVPPLCGLCLIRAPDGVSTYQ
jgi:hypothetical protein